jgi:hypothetical protein
MNFLDCLENVLGRFFFIDNSSRSVEHSLVNGGLIVKRGKDDDVKLPFPEQARDKVWGFLHSEKKVEQENIRLLFPRYKRGVRAIGGLAYDLHARRLGVDELFKSPQNDLMTVNEQYTDRHGSVET